MTYKAFHTDATVLVYEDGSVTVGLYESDREKAAELYKAFEDLPPDLKKESEIGLFTSINALNTQVFVSRRIQKRCERCGDIKPPESSCGCFDNGCE